MRQREYYSNMIFCVLVFIKDQQSTAPYVTGVIKVLCPLLPGGGVGGAIEAVIIDVPEPFSFTLTTKHIIRN